ncbi:hypothetical protein ACHAW5_004803 [Stephanodiscus triporus]|uniref:Metallo-beta-lactamase domain-containing protein n=1 Tax=Stephanodiscus triporus TaxID=2934178 RepID=A0ABD3MKG9_9STRA
MKSSLAVLLPIIIPLIVLLHGGGGTSSAGGVMGFRPPPSFPSTTIAAVATTARGNKNLAVHPSPPTPRLLLASKNEKNHDGGGDGDPAPPNNPPSPRLLLSRRQVGELAFAASGLGLTYLGTREDTPQEYGLWGVLPVGTYKTKQTVMETIVPDTIWTFDQKFGILNVQVPSRMTVIKLSAEAGGGLFVYDPIAATPELLGMMRKLEAEHGPVRHVVLGSVAIEHKVYAGVFGRKFPHAKVWVQPGQYSFPSSLPISYLGFPYGRTYTIPNSIADAPGGWKVDFDYMTLGPLISKDGAFGETVFFHKSTNTLLVTDTVLEVTDEVPMIFDVDPRPLLFHARSTVNEVVDDTREVRERGWRRVVLFGLFFTPGALKIKDVNTALAERRPDINSDFAGLYPWDWVGDDVASFKALQGGLLVAPILQQLILNREPVEVLDFADEVSKWPIRRIIPAHLKNNLAYTGKDYRAAFSFLEAGGVPPGLPRPLDVDMKSLRDAEVGLLESGAVARCPPLPGGDVSREDVLRQTVYGCRAGLCAPRSSP